MGLNCGFACELVGVLKVTTMVLLCTSIFLLIYATGDAGIYRYPEGLEKKCKDKRETANKQGIHLPPCPENWMGYTALGVFIICWVVSVIFFLIQTLFCTSIRENKQFQQIDCCYHLGAGLGVFFGGSCAVAFGILALIEQPCSLASGFEKVNCENFRGRRYHPELHVFAGLLGIFSAMTCGLAAIKMHNSSIFPDIYENHAEVGRSSA